MVSCFPSLALHGCHMVTMHVLIVVLPIGPSVGFRIHAELLFPFPTRLNCPMRIWDFQIITLLSVAVLVRSGSRSGPAATDKPDGLSLLIEAALSSAATSNEASAPRVEVVNIHSSVDGASGPGMGGGGFRLTASEKAARLEKVREYILAHPDLKGESLVDGINGHMGTTYSVSTVAELVSKVREELGQPVRGVRLSPAQMRRRDQIIDKYVAGHPTDSNADLAKAIAALLRAEDLPLTPFNSLPRYIGVSRRRLSLPANSNRSERNAVIEEFLRDHPEWQIQDMVAPIQQLMRAKGLTEITDRSLMDHIFAV